MPHDLEPFTMLPQPRQSQSAESAMVESQSSRRLLQDMPNTATLVHVSTAQELLNAVSNGTQDIVITEHLDLRHQFPLTTGQNIYVGAGQHTSLLYPQRLRSIRVRSARTATSAKTTRADM